MSNNKLKTITIRGFKSISYSNPVQLELGDVNILLGANGAGKSNLISFFKMLSYMMSRSLQRYVAQYGSSQEFLNYGAKKTPTLNADIRFENGSSYDIYSFSLTYAVPNRLIISSEEIKWKNCDQGDGIHRKQLLSDFNESALASTLDKACRAVYDFLSRCKVYQFNDSSATSPMRQPSTVDSAHYLQTEANNLSSFLYYLKNNHIDSYNRIVKYVQDVVPQFKDFYLSPEKGYISLKWIDTSLNDYVLSPSQFSDGSIRFIALATLLLQPERTMPSVIIIDEPELGLHPYAIEQLAEMIKDAALHVQIIVATQSPALIDNFKLEDITIVERDDDNQCTVARKLKEPDFSEWLKDYTISDLWNKNVLGGRPV